MSCDPQLPRFISVSYEVGSRRPDLHVFTLTQRVKNQYLSGRKVPNRQKYGWAGTKHLKPVVLLVV